MNEKPLPCPFCGKRPKFTRITEAIARPEIDHAYWSLSCFSKENLCPAQPTSFGDTKEGAISLWNQRANQPVARKQQSRPLNGVQLIAAERTRQIEDERYSHAHDDSHNKFEMTLAAISYAEAVANPDEDAEGELSKSRSTSDWPWAEKYWKPSDDPIRNLVKAGALIAAEIDRLQRLQGKAKR